MQAYFRMRGSGDPERWQAPQRPLRILPPRTPWDGEVMKGEGDDEMTVAIRMIPRSALRGHVSSLLAERVGRGVHMPFLL